MTRRDLQRLGSVAAVLAAAALAAPLAGQAQETRRRARRLRPARARPELRPRQQPRDRRRPGTGKVPHNDGAGNKWPALSGILWQVLDSKDRTKFGGAKNDELLGHHGDETLAGAGGHDIIWGDWDPKGNTTKQRDTLSGGAGNDWLYPSHGRTTVRGGPGRDYVWAYYGKGTIDCGPGIDTARVRTNGAFKLKGCEKIRHFCAHGENSKGQCLSPTGNPVPNARRRG